MENIVIQNEEPFTGSVEWLKEKIENMVFKFSQREGLPCVSYGFLEEADGEKKVKKWYTLAVLKGCPEKDYDFIMCCKEYKGAWVTYSVAEQEHVWSMFPYLTDNAKFYCERLITLIADKLLNHANTDSGSISITVIVK